MKKGKYTIEEINFLKNNYDSYEINELSILMDRTIDGIRYKASKLRLHDKNYYFNKMKTVLENNNYELLSDNFINAKTKYKIRCITHNEIKYSTYDCITSNRFGCDKCKSEKIINSNKANIEDVRNEFIKRNLIPKFTDEEYLNEKVKIKYLCKIHNDDYQYTSYDSLRHSDYGCIYCAAEYRGSIYRGEKHHNWKGGNRNENHKIRDTLEYSRWRLKILRRDNYTCQCCGARNGNGKSIHLRVHHKENFADNKELRMNINNGITLCSNCHDPQIVGSFHNTYGTHHNTEEQLNEYFKKYAESHQDSLLLCADL
jgi:hypothetical protein